MEEPTVTITLEAVALKHFKVEILRIHVLPELPLDKGLMKFTIWTINSKLTDLDLLLIKRVPAPYLAVFLMSVYTNRGPKAIALLQSKHSGPPAYVVVRTEHKDVFDLGQMIPAYTVKPSGEQRISSC